MNTRELRIFPIPSYFLATRYIDSISITFDLEDTTAQGTVFRSIRECFQNFLVATRQSGPR